MRRNRFALVSALVCLVFGLQTLPANADPVPWSGTASLSLSAASYTSNEPLPTYQASVSPALSGGYYLSLYNDLGQRVCSVQSGGCAGSLNAPLNGSRTYTAYVSYGTPPSSGPPTNDVRAVSGAVTVTNLGYVNSSITLTTSAASYTSNESAPTYQASVSPALSGGYYLSLYNDLGQRVCSVQSGECAGALTAPLNSTRSYTAYVAYGFPPSSSVPTNDVRAQSSTVSVTNLGYINSSITLTTSAAAYSTNESAPTFQASVSPSLSGGYYLSLYDDLGQRMCYVQSGECSGALTAPLNSTRSYTAYVAYGFPPSTHPPTNDVRAHSSTVSVTNVGWAGHFTSAEALVRDQAFLGATSATFEWDVPLAYVRVDVVDSSGEVIGSCSTSGSLACSAALALGPDESEIVHAEARASLPGGGFVTIATSAAVELTGMDSNAYANFVFYAPPASLPPLLGAARAQQALQIRTAVQSETFCLTLGAVVPSTAEFHTSVPDATLVCNTGRTAVLAYLILGVGVTGALTFMAYAATLDDSGGSEPTPEPEPDPTPDPGSGDSGTVPPAPPGGGGNFCEETAPDGTVYSLSYNELVLHIVRFHTGDSYPDKSKWAQALSDQEDLGEFICEALRNKTPLTRDETYNANTGEQGWALRYSNSSGDVGTVMNSGGPTSQFTIVVRSNGTVATSYPGWGVEWG